MDTVTKSEYLTAWRYTVSGQQPGFKKSIPKEVLEVDRDPEAAGMVLVK